MHSHRKHINSLSVDSKTPPSPIRNRNFFKLSKVDFHEKQAHSFDDSKSFSASHSSGVLGYSSSCETPKNDSLSETCIPCRSTDMENSGDLCNSLDQFDSNSRRNTLTTKTKKLTARELNNLLQYGPFQNKKPQPEIVSMKSPCYCVDGYTSQRDRKHQLEIGHLKHLASE